MTKTNNLNHNNNAVISENDKFWEGSVNIGGVPQVVTVHSLTSLFAKQKEYIEILEAKEKSTHGS